jgi:hypothetical protein
MLAQQKQRLYGFRSYQVRGWWWGLGVGCGAWVGGAVGGGWEEEWGVGMVKMLAEQKKYYALQSNTDTFIFSATRLPVNQLSQNLCELESQEKYKENKTYPYLLASTV